MSTPRKQVVLDEETRVDSGVSNGPDLSKDALPSSIVQVYGEHVGRRFQLGSHSLTFGRGELCDVLIPQDNVSRLHAEILPRGEYFALVDKGSTNGSFVNDRRVKGERILNPGDVIKIGGSIFKFLSGNDVETLYFEEIYRMTIIDGLTQTYNKRYLLEFLERELARCARYGRPIAAILFDIDYFKRINDTHGHLIGDDVLRLLAGKVNEKVRKEELFARYGGEEFCVIIPESNAAQAKVVAEKIRQLIETTEFRFDSLLVPVTVSLGVADWDPKSGASLADADALSGIGSRLLANADQQLYEAKRTGRNRVCAAVTA